MAKADIATLLALCAALCIAIGDAVQQRSAQGVSEEPVSHIELFKRLLKDPMWWLGSIAGFAGFGFQAAALAFGSVLLVQALIVTSLLFALPLSAFFAGRRITRWQWMWAVLLAGSVAVIVTVGNPTAGHSRAGWELWVWVVAIMGPAMAACLVGARMSVGKPQSAVLLALVAGSLWGLFAVLAKGVVGRLEHGIWAVVTAPELYVWLAVATAATLLQQASFGAGSLAASLPTSTVAEPVVAAVLGIYVLGETLRPGDSGWVALIAAFVVMVASTAALARGEAAGHQPATVAAAQAG
jgi:drug/metabolite transporter (DMT)-like permease